MGEGKGLGFYILILQPEPHQLSVNLVKGFLKVDKANKEGGPFATFTVGVVYMSFVLLSKMMLHGLYDRSINHG